MSDTTVKQPDDEFITFGPFVFNKEGRVVWTERSLASGKTWKLKDKDPYRLLVCLAEAKDTVLFADLCIAVYGEDTNSNRARLRACASSVRAQLDKLTPGGGQYLTCRRSEGYALSTAPELY